MGKLVPGGLNPGGWKPVLVGAVPGAEPGGLNPGGWNGTEGGVDDGLVWFAAGGLKPGGWNGVVVVAFWFGFHWGAPPGGLNPVDGCYPPCAA